jgi:peptidoglycan hydrolase-like protein with peptidoglycan-binding domain
MVQRVLKDSGFDFGSIDGILGPKTRAAKKYIQIKKGDSS